MVWWVGNS